MTEQKKPIGKNLPSLQQVIHVDPTRVIVDPVNPPDNSIYANPVSDQVMRRSPMTSQVGAKPNQTF